MYDFDAKVDKASAAADSAEYPKVKIYLGQQWMSVEDKLGPSIFQLIKGEVVRHSK